MHSIKSVIFFGPFYRIIQAVAEEIPVERICCESRSFNTNIYDYACLHSIPFQLINNSSDLDLLVPSQSCLGFSCSFGFIFKQRHINKFEHGIWNLHFGKLPQYRGRHPVSWAFLNNEKEIGITIHQINEEIDRGKFLSEDSIKRDLKDTPGQITEKIINRFCNGFFQDALKTYYSGNRSVIGEGIYRENLYTRFSGDIDPSCFDSKFLFNLFKSQSDYGGVKINGRKYSQCIFFNEQFSNLYHEYEIFTCNDNIKIGIK